MPRADRTTGRGPDRMAPARRRSTPATVILLVRHGTTATTGTRLPGRAPGLHLAEAGVRQAEDVAARIARAMADRAAAAHDAPDGDRTADPRHAPDDDRTAESRHAPDPDRTADPRHAPDDDRTADPRHAPDADRTAEAGHAPDGEGVAGTEGAAGQARGNGSGRPGEDAPRRGVAAVYSSPLERTRETAAPIAHAVGREVVVDEGLIELDVGEWTGLELKEARSRPEWATIQRYPSGFTFPGGESFAAMQGRMVAALARMRSRHPGETVVAVSHADPIRATVAHAMGTHLDLFQRIVVSPCSLTAIALGDEGPTVLTVNATGDEAALVPQ